MTTAAFDEATRAKFEKLFREPSIDALLENLTWQEFEDFIQYVFECAGYVVDKVASYPKLHVDLHLYVGKKQGKPVAVVEVRRYRNARIPAAKVLQFAGAVGHNGVKIGYLITTAGFTEPAEHVAHNHPLQIGLINGRRLLRYITYVGGSRVNGDYADAPISPSYPTELSYLFRADDLMKATARPPRRSRILTVANGKGGVAKTTSALNIAFALADHHKQRVLLIDMDGQASTTVTLPRRLPPNAPKDSEAPKDTAFISDYFRGAAVLGSLVRPTRLDNVWLVPAAYQLQQMDSGGGARPQAELRFLADVRMLQTADEQGQDLPPFDWVVIDTPPAQSFYARAAVAAADYVVIPAYAEQFAVQGLNGILKTVQTMSALAGVSNWQQKIVGCFIARWKPGGMATTSLATLVTELQAKDVRQFQQKIPYDDKVEQAHQRVASGGWRTIFRLAKNQGQAANAYDDVTEEILKHVNNTEAHSNHH